jgi:hypothetical protein
MAQAIHGKASAPLAKSNDAVTIFAKEGKQTVGADTVKPKAPKATKPVAATPAAPTPAPTPVTPAKPKPEPKTKQLAYVVEKQETQLHIRVILAPAIYIRQRMEAGQPRAEAIDAVFALYRKHAEGLLDEAATLGVDVRAALEPYVTRELPQLADRSNWNV